MDENASLLKTLLRLAESAAQKHDRKSRLTQQAFDRRLERNDSAAVARQLNEIYHDRVSRLPAAWRVAQQYSLNDPAPW